MIDSDARNDPALVSKARGGDGGIASLHEVQYSPMDMCYGIIAAQLYGAINVKKAIVPWSSKKVRLKLLYVYDILWPLGRDGDTIYAWLNQYFALLSENYVHTKMSMMNLILKKNTVNVPILVQINI